MRGVATLAMFLLGVFCASVFSLPIGVGYALLLGALVSSLYLFFIREDEERRRVVIMVLVCIVGFSFGLIRLISYDHAIGESVFESMESKEMEIEGVVIEPPRETTFGERVVVQVGEDKVLAILPSGSSVSYGDKIKVRGEAERPESFQNENGIVFDYPAYLRAQGITHLFEAKQVEIISAHHAPLVREYLYDAREKMIENLRKSLRGEAAGLLSGIVIGDKNGLDKDLEEMMVKVGVIHIAVFSGQNVALAALILFWIFSFLPYRIRLGVCFLSIIIFVLLSGAEAPAVRAGILASLVLLGRLYYRPVALGRALLLTASLMILWNPLSLVYDISFQLSFAAMLGIVFLAPLLRGGELVKATLGAQIAVLPLILHMSGTLSLWSIPANLLVLPVIPILLPLGLILSIFPFFLIALPVQILASYIIWVVEFLASLSWGSGIWYLGTFGMSLCYLILIALVVFFRLWLVPDELPKAAN